MSDPTDHEFARQRSQRENEKLSIEIDALRAQEKKLGLETQKLGQEIKHQKSARILEWVKAVGSYAVVLLGVVALGTLIWNILTHIEDSNRRVTQTVAVLLRDLGHESSSVRAAASIGLTPFVNEPNVKHAVVSGLASSLGLETNLLVQRTIARALNTADSGVVKHLSEILKDISSEITPLFSKLTSLEMGQQRLASGSDNNNLMEQLHDQVRELENLINARQRAAVILTFVVREHLGCRVNECQECPPNFSGLPLRYFSFVGFRDDFCGASFEGAQLSNADFYKLDLTKANFSDAQLHGASFLHTILTDTNFSNAHMEYDQNDPSAVAIFRGADLNGAIMDGACLAATDFTGVRTGLVVDQFRNSLAAGARFDKAFEKVLKEKGFVKEDFKKCPKIQSFQQ